MLLTAPAGVLLRRIRERTTNDYGKSHDQRAEILQNLAEVEPLLRATCTHEIDATRPIEHVVASLVTIGGPARAADEFGRARESTPQTSIEEENP